jgi:hypothetical protein
LKRDKKKKTELAGDEYDDDIEETNKTAAVEVAR